jgi:S-methylmethionine-dependent homocysteine/selenocysteine methylase
METVLVFHRGIDLPCFASFPLLDSDDGARELYAYFEPFTAIAREHGIGLLLDTPTWRANADWGAQLGYDADHLAAVNRKGVRLLERLRADHQTAESPILISGCIGPRDDAYRPAALMSADEAERYHAPQARTLAAAGVDVLTALTLTYPEEAIGIARAAAQTGTPVVISFTVETDGRLPRGTALGRRSTASTPRPTARLRTSWSTARTRRTSRTRSRWVRPGSSGWAASARTPRR